MSRRSDFKVQNFYVTSNPECSQATQSPTLQFCFKIINLSTEGHESPKQPNQAKSNLDTIIIELEVSLR